MTSAGGRGARDLGGDREEEGRMLRTVIERGANWWSSS